MSGPAGPAAPLALVLFSRAPVAGQTKTRLSPPLTPEQARDFHVATLNDLIPAARDWAARRTRQSQPVALHLCITPSASQVAFRRAGVDWPTDFAAHNQRGDDLGARMEHALRTALAEAPPGAAALLTGTDLPLLGPAQWDAAAEALRSADVVFGPTPDGGYYLVGLRALPAGLFDLPAWGGASVLERSLAAARAAGLRTALIEELPDVDTTADFPAVLGHPRAAELAGRGSLQMIRALLRSAGN